MNWRLPTLTLSSLIALSMPAQIALAQQGDDTPDADPLEVVEAPAKEEEDILPGDEEFDEEFDEELDEDIDAISQEEDEFVEEPIAIAPPVDFWAKLPIEFELLGPHRRDRLDEPGGAERISRETIARTGAVSVTELLGQATSVFGAHGSEMGIRPDIGVRGFSPHGSRHVLVLEDGVPIAASPYTDGELVYMTPIERVQEVEILKSSSTILFGPRNLGGAINIITTAPPRAFTPRVFLQGGSYGRLSMGASVGDVQGSVGYWMGINHRRYESPRGLDLEATDVSAKFKLQVSQRSWFGAKLSLYDEFSRDGDVGLTRELYARDPSQTLAPYDRDEVQRFAAAINHSYLLSDYGLWQTTLWAHQIGREHQQQTFDRRDLNENQASYERVVTASPRGVAADDGSSLFFRDETRVSEDDLDVVGVSSRLTLDLSLGKAGRTEVLMGIQALREDSAGEERRGGHGGSPAGSLERDEQVHGRALATYLATRNFFLEEKLRVFTGVRFEFLQTEHRVWRADTQDVGPQDLNPPIDQAASMTGILPGAGVSFDAARWATLFISAHRGMATPVAQHLESSSSLLDISPEFAWNHEIGSKFIISRWLSADVTGFWILGQDVALAQTNASGETTLERGETSHLGAEISGEANLAAPFSTNWKMPARGTYTYLDATLREGWPEASQGNLVPYAPANQWAAQLGLEHPAGFGVQATGRLVGRRYSDIEGTVEGNPDGLRGLNDDYFLLDARIVYSYRPWGATFHLTGKNLTDQSYISTRAPGGIQARGEREFMGGVQARF